MKTNESKIKPASTLLGILVLLAVVAIIPHAFAAWPGVGYTPADNPHGPLQMYAWAALGGVAGVMTGVGVYTAVKRHR